MENRAIKILKIVIPIGIGVYLTWYFFNGMDEGDIQKTKDAFFDANYFWIALSLFVAFLGHLSRAYRWRFLLEPLGYKPKLRNAYHAVMAGYVINYTIPRSGEVARAGLMTRYEKIPFEKGFATIIIERLIDVLMLGGITFFTGLLQTKSAKFDHIMASDTREPSYLVLYVLGGAALFGIALLGVYFKNEKVKGFINQKIKSFWEGLKSIWTMKKKWAFIFHTVFIWSSYIIMIWFSSLAFEETENLPLGALLGAFVVGAFAVALLPGGIGVYPLWITGVLAMYGVDFAGFGIFIWVVQTGLLVVLGLLSLFLIQRQSKIEIETK